MHKPVFNKKANLVVHHAPQLPGGFDRRCRNIDKPGSNRFRFFMKTFFGSQPHYPDHQVTCQDEALEKGGVKSLVGDINKEGEKQITDNVSVIPVHGHTPAMQMVLVQTPTGKHFFPTDLIPIAAHLHLPYIMAYDNNPLITVEEKQKILTQACREKWTLYFCQ